MSQYRTGLVNVTNGSANVVGSVTSFSTNVVAGDLFTVAGSGITYEIAGVTDDTHFSLTAPYAGTTATGVSYVIARDFTPNLDLPYIQKTDLETATILKAAFMQLDESIILNTVITSPSTGQVLEYNGTNWVNSNISVDIAGTANEVIVTPSGAGVVLSTPQAIATTSSPTFAGLTLTSGLTGTSATFSSTVAGTVFSGSGLNITSGSTNLIVVDHSGYTPTSGNPQGVLFRNSNVYSNTVGPYGAGGWIFQSTGIDNNQPKVFIQDNVSSISLGNSAWLELENQAGNLGTYSNGFANPNTVSTAAVGGSIEMITPMENVGALITVNSITGGSGYVNGTYTNVPLTATTGHGSYAQATIVVSGGAVSSVTVNLSGNAFPGMGSLYVIGDTLSASNANLGGSGSGFTCAVATIQYYNGKSKTISQSGITGSSAQIADGCWGVGLRRSHLHPSGVNSGFETTLYVYSASLVGQGLIVSTGNGINVTPEYDYGAAGGVTYTNAFESAASSNITSASGKSATYENTSTGSGGSSYIRTRSVFGSSTIYSEADDTVSSAQFVARSAWGGTPGTTSFSRIALLTDNSSADSGWYIDTVGTGGATPNLLNFKTRTAGAQSTVATMSAAGNWTAGTYNGQTISSAASLTGTLVVSGAATFNSLATFNSSTLNQSATNPSYQLKNTANSQTYQWGYNLSDLWSGFYDATAGGANWRLTIADTTGVVTIPTNIASTSSSTGAFVVSTGGVGIGGNLNVGGGIGFSLSASVTAAGTNQGTATVLTADTSVITTCASGTGVVLPSGVGREITVINRGANALLVYPPSGAQIDGAAANAATSVPVNGWLTVNVDSATQYFAIDPVTVAGAGISVTQSNNGTLTIGNTGVTSNVAGTGISVSGATGAVTISNTGVLSLTQGATAGVTLSGSTGAITIDTAQDIRTSASPTFVGATFSGAVGGITTLGTSGSITAQTALVATSGSNKSSPQLVLGGSIWNGTSAVNDTFTVGVTYAAGTNPLATLTIAHASGTSGGSQTALASGNLVIGGGGNFSTLDGVVTTGAGVPVLQFAHNATAQTANIGTTSLVSGGTNVKAGLYRVSVYIVVTTAGSVSSTMPDSQIIYTDQDSGAAITVVATAGSSGNTTSTFARNEFLINVAAAGNIQFNTGVNTAYASSAAGMQYAIRHRLEWLG